MDERFAEIAARVQEMDFSVRELRNSQDTNKREAESKRRDFVQLTQQSSQSDSKIAALKERIKALNRKWREFKIHTTSFNRILPL